MPGNFDGKVGGVVVIHIYQYPNGRYGDRSDDQQRYYRPYYFERVILSKGCGDSSLGFAMPDQGENDDSIDHRHNGDHNPDDIHMQAVNLLTDRRHSPGHIDLGGNQGRAEQQARPQQAKQAYHSE